MSREYPPHVEEGIRAGARLEIVTLAWLVTVIPLMAFVMGSSQAMKTVWIEDMLSVIPPVVHLVSTRLERREPTRDFPYGFHRVNSVAFVISAAALTIMGGYLLVEAAMTLVMADHPTIGTMRLFDRDVWLGWLMIGALLWSSVPAVFLGRAKLPIARKIQDKVLHTDAEMQKADWMSGAAAIGGVIGIGFGLWWMDAAAAGLISFSILHDGIKELRSATAELVDGTPRKLERDETATEAKLLQERLSSLYPGSSVRMRESGRFINAQVCGIVPDDPPDLDAIWPGPEDRSWRFAQLSFAPSTTEEEA